MIGYAHILNSHQFASAYGEGSFNSSTYNGEVNTNTAPGTTVPGTPNTGFFGGVLSGANEASLIPLLLIVAIAIGAVSVGISKVIKRRRAHSASN